MTQRTQTWTCATCGVQCERQHQGGMPPKYCSKPCAKKAEKRRRHAIRCIACGKAAQAYAPDVQTCSRRCRGLLQGGRSFSISQALVHIPRERRPIVPVKPHPVRLWATIVQGPCGWCGEQFTALTTTGEALTCSMRCLRQMRRDRRGRFAVPDSRRRRLYERDGWKCRICRRSTARDYSPTDPWSPTLDHIAPAALTLFRDDSDANLRTAHLICNSLRGDGRMSDVQVRLALRVRAPAP